MRATARCDGIDAGAGRGGGTQRAADAAPALLRRLAAAPVAGQGEARAQRQRAFRLDAAAGRRRSRTASASMRAWTADAVPDDAVRPACRSSTERSRARGYVAFDPTLVQVAALGGGPGSPRSFARCRTRIARLPADRARCSAGRRIRARARRTAWIDRRAAYCAPRAPRGNAACCADDRRARGWQGRRLRPGYARWRARRNLRHA